MKSLKQKKPLKILVAMSGGVDSSVAALLLKKQGYDVIGAFMKNYSEKKNSRECNWKKEREYAILIASILKIPLITLDFEKQYRKKVIEKMFIDYHAGKTPNPDIDCNQKVKFPLLIEAAKTLGCDFVATGHYARIKNVKGKFELLRAKDESKDQSYFLYRLKQSELKHLIFPVGDYKKSQIREIALKNNFPNFDKKSTVGICFVGKVDMKRFLKKKLKPKNGKILNPEGKIIGEHDGIYYYTIGQRPGPRNGINFSKDIQKNGKIKRWYIAEKDAKKNTIIVAPEGHKILYRKDIFLKNPHWINSPINKKKKILARIRHLGKLLKCTVAYDKKKKKFFVVFDKPTAGLSEGQALVLYEGKKVIGGGEISFEQKIINYKSKSKGVNHGRK